MQIQQIILNSVENERELVQTVTKLTTDDEPGKTSCVCNDCENN